LNFIKSISTNWIIGLCLLFAIINAWLIYNDFYWGLAIPVLLTITVLSILSLDTIILLIVFLTPLSVTLENSDFNLGLSLPTEPLMFGVTLIFFFKLLYEKKYDSKVIAHPVSIALLISLAWTFITSMTSEMPMVSFKFMIARLWFVIPFYFMAVLMFKDLKNVNRFLWLYIIALAAVVIYTVVRHSGYNFEHKPAHWVMEPFFNDHTSYGAMLAMFLPAFIYFLKANYSNTKKLIIAGLFFVFIIGTILSYTRAAWLSLVLATGLSFVYLLRIRFISLLFVTAMLIAGFFTFKTELTFMLQKNKTDSSDDFSQHVKSISNITSDASNLERINRWQSAFRMFEERPFFGWGPGTYAFQYAPFQHSTEKTIISTNAGDGGNAHSEYIGPLAEQGVFGTLSFIAILLCVFYRGTMLYTHLENKQLKFLLLMIIAGFSTYVMHGFLNNFLDTDKAAVPFWGFIAIIVALDIYHSENKIKPID
jgi:putative inorganic carbon (hco3(-)) transporter